MRWKGRESSNSERGQREGRLREVFSYINSLGFFVVMEENSFMRQREGERLRGRRKGRGRRGGREGGRERLRGRWKEGGGGTFKERERERMVERERAKERESERERERERITML